MVRQCCSGVTELEYAPFLGEFDCVGISGDCFLKNGVCIDVDEVKKFDIVQWIILDEISIRSNQ